MNFNLFVNAIQILLRDVGDLNDLTRIYFFRWVNGGAHSLLLLTWHVLQQVSCKLGLAYLTVLAHSQYIVHKDDEVVYLAYLWLLS